MPDILSKEEIDDLLTQKHGDSSKENKMAKKTHPTTADGKPIITYDFKHPQRVSKDQQRTLENLHSNFSRMMASSFSTMQRSVVDCDIAFVDQTTYAEFIMSLSNPSCSYTFSIEPLGGPAILDFSLPVAFSFVDRQFGGIGKNPPKEARPLTGLERQVMAKVVTRSLADLEATWKAFLKIQISDAELETNPEFMQVAAPSDTVILIAFEVNSQHASGLVNLCFPYFTLEPVMPYLNVQAWASRERGRRETNQKERVEQLKSVKSDVTAICARGKMTVDDVAHIQVGDTLVMDTHVDDPSIVCVENVPLFMGKSGRSPKGNYAVELTRSISFEEESDHV